MQTKTTVDKVFGRKGREMPALKGVNNNRAAVLERLGQFPDGSSAYRIEDETKLLPVESLLDILLQVVALVDYTIASKLADLLDGLFERASDNQVVGEKCRIGQVPEGHGQVDEKGGGSFEFSTSVQRGTHLFGQWFERCRVGS